LSHPVHSSPHVREVLTPSRMESPEPYQESGVPHAYANVHTTSHQTLRVLYCTGNFGKFSEASHVFDEWNASGSFMRVEYSQVDADPVEIQGDCEAVGVAKVSAATRLLIQGYGTERQAHHDVMMECSDAGVQCDVVTEDVSLHLRSLNGFPGPYCKPMLAAIGDDGLWQLVSRYEDKFARVQCTLAAVSVQRNADNFSFDDNCIAIHTGVLDGTIGPPKGNVKHGATSWNSVFTPDGHDLTFGETPFETQARFSHRRLAIMRYLESTQTHMIHELDHAA
jgi:inosine triphosphate pyrophosphatase